MKDNTSISDFRKCVAMILFCAIMYSWGCIDWENRRKVTPMQCLTSQVRVFSMRVAIPVIRREIGPDEWNAFLKENTGAPFSCLGNEEEHGLSGTYFINPDSSLWEKMGTGAIDIEITMLLILNGEKNTGSSKFFICKGARNLIQVDKAEFEKQRAYFESVAKNGSAPVNR